MLWNIWIGNDAHGSKVLWHLHVSLLLRVCGLVHVNTCDAMINVNDR